MDENPAPLLTTTTTTTQPSALTSVNEEPVYLKPINVPDLAGVNYDIPVIANNGNVQNDIIGPGNFTIDECMTRPLEVISQNIDKYPATQLLYNNIAKATSYLQVLIPEASQNVEAADLVTKKTQATLKRCEEFEKSLTSTWWNRKLTWGVAVFATISLTGFMLMNKATPNNGSAAGKTVLEGAATLVSNILEAVTPPAKTTAKNIPEKVTLESTYNLFLDNPLTCLTIVGVTVFTVVCSRKGFQLVSWTLSKLKK